MMLCKVGSSSTRDAERGWWQAAPAAPRTVGTGSPCEAVQRGSSSPRPSRRSPRAVRSLGLPGLRGGTAARSHYLPDLVRGRSQVSRPSLDGVFVF